MELLNTRDYIKTGDHIAIKDNNNLTLMRFYFADYQNDEDCKKAANRTFVLLKAVEQFN